MMITDGKYSSHNDIGGVHGDDCWRSSSMLAGIILVVDISICWVLVVVVVATMTAGGWAVMIIPSLPFWDLASHRLSLSARQAGLPFCSYWYHIDTFWKIRPFNLTSPSEKNPHFDERTFFTGRWGGGLGQPSSRRPSVRKQRLFVAAGGSIRFGQSGFFKKWSLASGNFR